MAVGGMRVEHREVLERTAKVGACVGHNAGGCISTLGWRKGCSFQNRSGILVSSQEGCEEHCRMRATATAGFIDGICGPLHIFPVLHGTCPLAV